MKSCPLSAPFVDGEKNECFECKGIYNVGEKKCEQCSENEEFNREK